MCIVWKEGESNMCSSVHTPVKKIKLPLNHMMSDCHITSQQTVVQKRDGRICGASTVVQLYIMKTIFLLLLLQNKPMLCSAQNYRVVLAPWGLTSVKIQNRWGACQGISMSIFRSLCK